MRIIVQKISRKLRSLVMITAAGIVTVGLLTVIPASTASAKGTGASLTSSWQAFRKQAVAATKGKTFVWIPTTLGNPANTNWAYRMQLFAESEGMNFKLLNPNLNAATQTTMLATLIPQLKPGDVIALNPSSASNLSSGIQTAEKAGIYVIAVNMGPTFHSDVYVGDDFVKIGHDTATDMVKACNGPGSSHEIAIVQAESTAALSQQMDEGAMPVFNRNKTLKIVANVNGNWDPTQANQETSVILKAHPKLCGIWGQWSTMATGMTTAIKQAGLQGKVNLYSWDSPNLACAAIRSGGLTETYNNLNPAQADIVVSMAATLMQSGQSAASMKPEVIFTPSVKVTSSNVGQPGMCYSDHS